MMAAPKNSKESPKTQNYANLLYELMDSTAVDTVITGGEYRVWRGSLTRTCHEVGIPKGVERRVTKLLEELESIQILQRGSRQNPTVVALLGPPTLDRMQDHQDRVLTVRPTAATLSLEVEAIKRMLGGVDLQHVLINFEERIRNLEEKNASQ